MLRCAAGGCDSSAPTPAPTPAPAPAGVSERTAGSVAEACWLSIWNASSVASIVAVRFEST